jgi:6-pyruvoyl tetrahydropterin synthase/QueD family protein
MYEVTKCIHIDFAHHVAGHQGACINIHGHTWAFEMTLAAQELDANGFVVDFKSLKNRVLQPAHDLLDHALALSETTVKKARAELEGLGKILVATRATPCPLTKGVPAPLAGGWNEYPGGIKLALFHFTPTSERLAQWLYGVGCEAFASDPRVMVISACIYETLHPVESKATFRG